MKKIYIFLVVLSLSLIGSLFFLNSRIERQAYQKGIPLNYSAPYLQTALVNPFSISGYDYKVLSKTGNESIYNVEFNEVFKTTNLVQICIYSDAPTKEIKEVTFDNVKNRTIEKSFNYSIPSTLSLYKTEELIKSSNLNLTLEKLDYKSEIPTFEVGDKLKFCYIADKTKDFYLKFGDNSVIVILEANVVSQSTLVNVTAETGASNFTHLNISTTAPYDSLVGYWNFDGDLENTKLTTAYDWSGKGNDGTYFGDVSVNSTCGKYGEGGCFDGSGDSIDIGDADIVEGVAGMTVSAWVKTPLTESINNQIVTQYGTGSFLWRLIWDSGEDLKFTVYNNTGAMSEGETIGAVLTDSNWHHVVGVYNGTNVYVYYDGVIGGTKGALSGSTGVSTYEVMIGATATSPAYWNGSIDDVMIFNTSLTEAQILEIYNNQSARFMNTGTQDYINQTNLNISTGNNRVNVSTTFDALMGSSVNLTIGYYDTTEDWSYTDPQALTSNTNMTFTISDTSTNLTLNYTLIAGNSTNPFYSPIVYGDITFEVWNDVGAADTEYPIFYDYVDNNSTLIDTGTGIFNVSVNSTNGTVILHIDGNDILAENLTANMYNATYDFTSGGVYLYNWTSYGNGTSANLNTSVNRFYTVNSSAADADYPIFYDINYSIANGTEFSNYVYNFNVSINSTNGTAGIDFDGTNYSLSNISSLFNYSFPSLSVGTYPFYFWAKGNGTSNLHNTTITYYYTVKQNNSYVITLANSTNLSVEYPIQTTMTGEGCPSQIVCNLSNNVSGFLINPDTKTLGVDNYNYTYNTSGNTNYSAKAVSSILRIIKNSTLVLTQTYTSPITYGTATDFAGVGCPAQLTCTLNLTNGVFMAGTINSNYSTNGNANYSATSNISSILINKATSVNCGLFVNPGATVTYPTANKFQTINPGDPGDADIDLNLYRDNIEVSNPDNTILGVGVYQYLSNMTGGQNWTDKASCGGSAFTVNQATGVVNGTINGTQGNFTAINGTAVQNIWVNATNKTGYGTGSIYLNGTLINSGTMPLSNLTNLSVGFYNITFIYDGNTNYSSDEEVWWVNITEVLDTTNPSFTNLRNFTHVVNTSFSQSITATDVSGISSYWLNDTAYFIINISTGLITNSTNLSRIETHNLNISVNDTLGNLNSGIFWINIAMPSPPSNVTYSAINQCKYKKLGYYNLKLPWFKESGCL